MVQVSKVNGKNVTTTDAFTVGARVTAASMSLNIWVRCTRKPHRRSCRRLCAPSADDNYSLWSSLSMFRSSSLIAPKDYYFRDSDAQKAWRACCCWLRPYVKNNNNCCRNYASCWAPYRPWNFKKLIAFLRYQQPSLSFSPINSTKPKAKNFRSLLCSMFRLQRTWEGAQGASILKLNISLKAVNFWCIGTACFGILDIFDCISS